MPLRIDRFVAFLGIATLFLPGFRIRTDAGDLYLYYGLLPIILILSIASGSRLASRALMLFLMALAAHSLLSIGLFENTPARAAQQFIGITIVCVVFYSIFYVNRFDTATLFRIYMIFSVFSAVVGLIQVFSYILGIGYGYDLSWLVLDYYQSYSVLGLPRIQSLFSEPSNFALILSPAIFVSVLNLTGRHTYFIGKPASAAVLLAAALSFSTMAYMAIVFALFLVSLQRGMLKWALITGLAACLAFAVYIVVPDVAVRVDDTLLAFFYADPVERNLSTLTLYNNWRVALGNLGQSYFLGGGLGSHPLAFERHSTLFSLESLPFWLAALNAQDANSLFLRILSELGLPGVLVLFGLLASRYVWPGHAAIPGDFGPAADDGARIVSNAALTFIAMALIRHGHYFAFGTPFFLMLYCYAGSYGRQWHATGERTGLDERGTAELSRGAT